MKRLYPRLSSLRSVAALAVFRVVTMVSAAITGTMALAFDERLLLPALVLAALYIVAVVAGFAFSRSIRCLRCDSPLFLPRTCDKHPRAKSFLGSHLTEMALDILLGTSFRCMYCAESCGCRKVSKHSATSHVRRVSRKAPGAHPNVPSREVVSRVLGRDPSTAGHALRHATHVSEINGTRTPVHPQAPAVPRAPYPSPRNESTSPFGAPTPATAPPHPSEIFKHDAAVVA